MISKGFVPSFVWQFQKHEAQRDDGKQTVNRQETSPGKGLATLEFYL